MTISHSYFVVMEDLGHRGLEAIVHPEDTRRDVVARIKSGEFKMIVFIHHVDGLLVEDVTDELIDAAEIELKEEYQDRKALAADHARDLLKHRREEFLS